MRAVKLSPIFDRSIGKQTLPRNPKPDETPRRIPSKCSVTPEALQ